VSARRPGGLQPPLSLGDPAAAALPAAPTTALALDPQVEPCEGPAGAGGADPAIDPSVLPQPLALLALAGEAAGEGRTPASSDETPGSVPVATGFSPRPVAAPAAAPASPTAPRRRNGLLRPPKGPALLVETGPPPRRLERSPEPPPPEPPSAVAPDALFPPDPPVAEASPPEDPPEPSADLVTDPPEHPGEVAADPPEPPAEIAALPPEPTVEIAADPQVGTDADPGDPDADPDLVTEEAGSFHELTIEPLAASAPRERLADRRFTLIVVPAQGGGPLRQVELGLRQLRSLATGAGVLLVLAIVGLVAGAMLVPLSRSRRALLEENIALKASMQDVERKLEDVDAELRRLRLYNTQLEELPLEGIPGFGPLAVDDVGSLIWTGHASDATWPQRAASAWTPGMPMEEPPGEEVAPPDLTEAEARALELSARADRILEGVRLVEPQVGELVETAQEWRWRQETLPSTNPCPNGVFTSDFGWRRAPFSRRWKFHTGLDLAAPRGTPIYAAGAGTVERAGWSSGYGRMLVIDHGDGIKTRYAHTSRILVAEGDHVERGQHVAAVGNTGRTTGPHLHFEVYVDGVAVDPEDFIDVQ